MKKPLPLTFTLFIGSLGIVELTSMPPTVAAGYRQQETPTIPASVLATAQQAMTAVGEAYRFTPENASVYSIDRTTGDTIWIMRLSRQEPRYFVKVDEQLNAVVEISDATGDAAMIEAVQAGNSPSVTREQAIATVQNFLAQFGPQNTDIRLSSADLDSDDVDHTRYWTVLLTQYVAGLPTWPLTIYGKVDAFTGKVQIWSQRVGINYIAPVAPLISPAQAQQVAQSALDAYAADMLEPGEIITPVPLFAAPEWAPVTDTDFGTSPDYRPAYVYSYPMPATANRTKHPFIMAMVDAQTGELWRIENHELGLEKGRGRFKPVPSSPRFALLAHLSGDKALAPLVWALATGTPDKNAKPDKKAQHFTRKVGGKDMAFAFNASAQRLTWESAPGKWAGVALPAKQADALKTWLEKGANSPAR